MRLEVYEIIREKATCVTQKSIHICMRLEVYEIGREKATCIIEDFIHENILFMQQIQAILWIILFMWENCNKTSYYMER